jgi:hypothetical protein
MTRILILLVFCTAMLSAQQWRWPEHLKNGKALPADITADQLRNTMTGYTNALGVRCPFCHVGEDGKPFSEFDFPSDQVPMKDIARRMIRLTNTVNASIKDIFKGGTEEPIEVTCATCHHGSPAPQRIEDVLWQKYELKGITETVTLFKEMRKRYYGSYTFDFRENVLLSVAQRCEREKKNVDDALVLVELNAEYFPDSPRTLMQLASYYIEKKEPQKAKPLIEKVLSIDPDNEFAKRMQGRMGK